MSSLLPKVSVGSPVIVDRDARLMQFADLVAGPCDSVWATRRIRDDADIVRRRAGAHNPFVGDMVSTATSCR